MNQIQNTESGEAILKDSYPGGPQSPLGEALRRRRKKLADTMLPKPIDQMPQEGE